MAGDVKLALGVKAEAHDDEHRGEAYPKDTRALALLGHSALKRGFLDDILKIWGFSRGKSIIFVNNIIGGRKYIIVES